MVLANQRVVWQIPQAWSLIRTSSVTGHFDYALAIARFIAIFLVEKICHFRKLFPKRIWRGVTRRETE